MKILSFVESDGPRLGVVDGQDLIDLTKADNRVPRDLRDVLSSDSSLEDLAGIARNAPAASRRPLESVRYGLPVARPGKIICLGLNYINHVKEGRYADNVPKWPSLFMRTLQSLVPHNEPLVRPHASATFDYEAELVAIIGRHAKDLSAANALSCVAGYSCANEGSVREFQRHTTQWTAGKNFDRSGSIGPWMVTADELPAGATDLNIQTRLNGKQLQSDNTRNMMFPVVETLVYVSTVMALEPGDVLLMGTPSGVGHAQKPDPIWMKPGDVCEIEIENIGVLSNPIVSA